MSVDHPNVARVVAAAEAAGLAIEVTSFPEGTRTAADAAAAIGCDVAQIVKSLVFSVDGAPVLALVSGVNQLDPDKLVAARGGSRAERADAEAVRRLTGFPIGGVAPLGTTERLDTYVDRTLLAHDEIWAAAGTPSTVFRARPPHALVDATGGVVLDLAAG